MRKSKGSSQINVACLGKKNLTRHEHKKITWVCNKLMFEYMSLDSCESVNKVQGLT
jgi:two-component SAPR family response regulator